MLVLVCCGLPQRLGLHLPTGDEGDDMQSLILPAPGNEYVCDVY